MLKCNTLHFRRVIIFIIAQIAFIISSPYIQITFQSFINYSNPYHLLFIFLVVIPYLSVISTSLILGSAEKTSNEETVTIARKLNFDKIDFLLITICVATCVIAYHKWMTYELPVGFDTPTYLATAKKVFLQDLSASQFFIFRRLIYYYLLGALISLFGGNDILVGKILWLQAILILFANYLLVRYITRSKIISFCSSMVWIFWIRMARLLTDLHSNTFGIFLILVSQFFLIKLLKEPMKKWLALFIFSWILLGLIHELSFYVFSASVISYMVLSAISKNTFCQRFKYLRCRIIRCLAMIFPWVIFIAAVIPYNTSYILEFNDMLR